MSIEVTFEKFSQAPVLHSQERERRALAHDHHATTRTQRAMMVW